MPGSAGENLHHEDYGDYEDVPHTKIDLYGGEWTEGVKQALEYKVGPPVAWEFRDGAVHLWGENLDENTLKMLADACNELEREFSDQGIYDAAEDASTAASKVIRADIEQPAEADA